MNIFAFLQGIITLPIAVSFIVIGGFLILVDVPALKKMKLYKDEKIARGIGYFYIIGIIGFYIISSIL